MAPALPVEPSCSVAERRCQRSDSFLFFFLPKAMLAGSGTARSFRAARPCVWPCLAAAVFRPTSLATIAREKAGVLPKDKRAG